MVVVLGPCPVLVERDAELHALSTIAAEVAWRGARLVVVTGEAGAGKSRLIAELVETLPDGWSVTRPAIEAFDANDHEGRD